MKISRRMMLSGTCAAAVAAGAGWRPQSARAQRARLEPAAPYSAGTMSGPSSRPVPAVGSTQPVPGTPFLVPNATGWSAVSLLTTGNEVGGYYMSGCPDGLGAFDNGDGTITVLMNHEIDGGDSVRREHGFKGSFVSRWVIDKSSLAVLRGRDFVQRPDRFLLWEGRKWVPGVVAQRAATALALKEKARAAKLDSSKQPEIKGQAPTPVPPASTTPAAPPGPPSAAAIAEMLANKGLGPDRLCSADLAPVSAFWDRDSGRGYDGHIFLNGEEAALRVNRAFAWVVATDTAYELPAFVFGKAGSNEDPPPAWENLLANPASGRATVVVGNSDGGPSRIYAYIGEKQARGNPVERAGLTNGRLFSLRAGDVDVEDRAGNIGIAKSRLGAGEGKPVSLVPYKRGTAFKRPEDGAWDPVRPNIYYFATSDRNNFAAAGSLRPQDDPAQIGRSRLWAVTFDDVAKLATDGRPVGKIELLVDGTEGGDMFDNITVDRNGVVYLCEDTGDARHNNKIWAYDTRSGSFTAIFRLDPAKFGDIVDKTYVPPTPPFVDDKESSGILDVTPQFTDAPWFRPGSTVLLTAVQPHFGYDGAVELGNVLYEGGQLLLLVKAP